jgi:membrane protein implicated in regulation of membrane protease activity
MRPVSKLVGVTFLLAVAGVLFLLALVVKVLLGLLALAALVLLLVAVLTVAIGRARRRTALRTAGRTCTCCTGTVHDPVQVI